MDKHLSSVDKPWIKNYPSHINWSTELHFSSIFDGLKKSSEINPNRDAIIFMGKKWTYEYSKHTHEPEKPERRANQAACRTTRPRKHKACPRTWLGVLYPEWGVVGPTHRAW